MKLVFTGVVCPQKNALSRGIELFLTERFEDGFGKFKWSVFFLFSIRKLEAALKKRLCFGIFRSDDGVVVVSEICGALTTTYHGSL